MAAFSLRQGEQQLTIGSSNNATNRVYASSDSPYIPSSVVPHLNSTFITPEVQATYAALRQAEIDAVRVRQAWVKSLADSLQPQVADFLDNFPHTHPEAYL